MLDQITLTDSSPDKFQFLIGYVRGFEYLAEDVKSIFNPHPIVGNVYQLLKRDDCYILHLGEQIKNTQFKGIFLGTDLKAHVENKWDVDVVIINKENMFDYSISTENLQILQHWLETDHKELREELSKIKSQSESPMSKLVKVIEQKTNDHAKMALDLNELKLKDPDTFDVVQKLVSYLATNNTQLALRGSIMRSKTHEGFCSSAISTIEDYSCIGDDGLLMKLIELCTYELNRKIYQGTSDEI